MSATLCGMPYEDLGGEEVEHWRETKIRVRKDHQCMECGGGIPPGSEAGVAVCLYEGIWDRLYRCQACLILAEQVATVLGECSLWGALDLGVERANEQIERYDEELDEYVGGLPGPFSHRVEWDAA